MQTVDDFRWIRCRCTVRFIVITAKENKKDKKKETQIMYSFFCCINLKLKVNIERETVKLKQRPKTERTKQRKCIYFKSSFIMVECRSQCHHLARCFFSCSWLHIFNWFHCKRTENGFCSSVAAIHFSCMQCEVFNIKPLTYLLANDAFFYRCYIRKRRRKKPLEFKPNEYIKWMKEKK